MSKVAAILFGWFVLALLVSILLGKFLRACAAAAGIRKLIHD